MSSKSSVLVVDDDASLRRVVEFTLQEAGLRVQTAASAAQALELLEHTPFDLVITDVRMPGMSGVELLAQLRRKSPDVPVVLMTAFATIELAVEAMRAGAFDYLSKPVSREALTVSVHRALHVRKLEAENVRLRALRSDAQRIVGDSAPMQAVVEKLRRAAASNAAVLVTGESGTGKELAARAIHDWSARAEGPWTVVNCGAMPRELIESELFGHVRGAFTGAVRDRPGKFEVADGGTIFLDEIAELEPVSQVRLLRVLQERTFERVGDTRTRHVDVRVVAATNVNLEAAVASGRMRADLYYRLAVIPVHLPPLRERREDIPILTQHLLRRLAPDEDISVAAEAMHTLCRNDWKGNVRELSNVLARAVALRRSNVLTLDDIGAAPEPTTSHLVNLPVDGAPLDAIVRDAVMQALTRCNWNQSQAARMLRVPRHILLYRMQKLGIGGSGDVVMPPEGTDDGEP